MPRRRAAQRQAVRQLSLNGVTPAPKLPAVRGRSQLPRQSEKAFMAAVIEAAHLLGWRHFHDNATNGPLHCWHCGRRTTQPRNPAGFPDLVLVRRPRLVWAELKAEGGVVSPEQAAWLDDLRACGQEVYLWTPTPSDWAEITRVLAR